MKKRLILEVVATPAFLGDHVSRRLPAVGEQRYRTSFDDPVELLRLMRADRMKIVQLLLESGPLPVEQIAARTLASNQALTDDLQKLLETGIVLLNANDEYCFDYDGIQITAEWPLSNVESNENVTIGSRSYVKEPATSESSLLSRAPSPNPAPGYSRKTIHILMGFAFVLMAIEVIMFLIEH
ncbi:helix-turn-helix domain-containing protein [Paraburkholderia sp. DHOC27]|uniref:winged helix-turn-helix domain-containing protein n=1 Tax=Paraburkholderia sp. DHOC27 TaxID=2303330 RepID=UPI000E3C8C60|nr:helix-turn-helix domain-containing protein [Paraburkholderia sp. DHOC27]RFU44467.1 ArsR family transcriptional regulator [Paraburkholderia sp. DHOC27]